jgi:hypothetical protein
MDRTRALRPSCPLVWIASAARIRVPLPVVLAPAASHDDLGGGGGVAPIMLVVAPVGEET